MQIAEQNFGIWDVLCENTAVLSYFLHTIEFVYSYVYLVCFVPLFLFIFHLFPMATRQSYVNNHGISHNTLGAVDSLNT
jgi:hypothetical protein